MNSLSLCFRRSSYACLKLSLSWVILSNSATRCKYNSSYGKNIMRISIYSVINLRWQHCTLYKIRGHNWDWGLLRISDYDTWTVYSYLLFILCNGTKVWFHFMAPGFQKCNLICYGIWILDGFKILWAQNWNLFNRIIFYGMQWYFWNLNVQLNEQLGRASYYHSLFKRIKSTTR